MNATIPVSWPSGPAVWNLPIRRPENRWCSKRNRLRSGPGRKYEYIIAYPQVFGKGFPLIKMLAIDCGTWYNVIIESRLRMISQERSCMMKKVFTEPEVEVQFLAVVDVIATSDNSFVSPGPNETPSF